MSLFWGRFDAVAEALALQGFNVIPLPPGAKGAAGSGVVFRHLNKRDSRRVTLQDRNTWERVFRRKGFEGSVGAYLLPASNPSWCYAIVDVDDESMMERALETFGDSPLKVSRGGRVRHLYFRTRDPKAAHLIGAFGRRTVDVISATGVVLPGSVHEDGDTYELSIPLSDWTPEWVTANVPWIDLEAIAELKAERRGALKQDLSVGAMVEGSAAGFIHARDPLDFGDSVWCGHVLPGTIIQTVEGPLPLAKVPAGAKCFATYRDDSHPSAHVSDYRGRRYFWDMSAEPKRYWTMTDTMDGEQDPELGEQDLPTALRERLGVEVQVVHDDGWLSDQVDELEDDSTTFLIAPHGSGKTVLARREHDRARTSVSVCNTQALTIANAAVLNLKPVYQGVDTEPKGSACIPSLHRYEKPPEFFHVDEADAVHGFLHSGKVDEPLVAWRTLAYFAALSKRSLIASADLSFEDVALFVHAIRERNATRRIKVVVRVPLRVRCTLAIRSVSAAKETIHSALTAKRDAPLFVGITTRKLAGQIAQGYRSAASVESVDLDAIATSVVDTPNPVPLDLGDLPDAEVDAPFFVSGENNRYHASVKWLEDTDLLVDSHDLIVTSPAVQSGVSLDRPVSKVVVLHENREVPADAVLQIARRCRNPEDAEVVVGVRRWKPQPHRTDRTFLDDLARKRARTTVRAVLASFPEFQEDHETPVDAEFLWSWRITTRKSLRSYADPIGELIKAAERHGFKVDVALDGDGNAEEFHTITGAAKEVRERINATETAAADVIDPDTRQRLERAPRLLDGERQEMDKATLAMFYGMEVTPDLVLLDNGGKYRSRVRAYTHARLFVDAPDVLAYVDHLRGKGRQPTELRHTFAKAALMADLFEWIFGRPFDGQPAHTRVQWSRPRVVEWWKRNRAAMVAFFPRLKGPADGKAIHWLGSRMRSLGAEVDTSGKNSNRLKVFDFTKVDHHAEAYGLRLFESFDQCESEKWRKEWEPKTSLK